jgi:hypothetical protein
VTRERGLLAVASVLLTVLAVITWARPPTRELTSLTAPTSLAAAVGGERLAEAVRYADLRVNATGTLRVAVRGDHGGVLLSLVDADDQVREVQLEQGESIARFGAVEPGAYAIRALAAPPEPPATGDAVTIRVMTGGRPWALFGAAALLVGGPPIVLLWRRRRTRGDDEPSKR